MRQLRLQWRYTGLSNPQPTSVWQGENKKVFQRRQPLPGVGHQGIGHRIDPNRVCFRLCVLPAIGKIIVIAITSPSPFQESRFRRRWFQFKITENVSSWSVNNQYIFMIMARIFVHVLAFDYAYDACVLCVRDVCVCLRMWMVTCVVPILDRARCQC